MSYDCVVILDETQMSHLAATCGHITVLSPCGSSVLTSLLQYYYIFRCVEINPSPRVTGQMGVSPKRW